MRKIKDDVNLKELERFGFSQLGKPMFNDWFKNLDNNVFIVINERNHIFPNSEISAYRGHATNWLYLGGNTFDFIELKEEYIQDLIEAGLVEEV